MTGFLPALGISITGRDVDPDYAACWQSVRAAAAESLESPMRGRDVTDRPAGWGHNYFCPTHGVALEFTESEPDRHRCPDFDHEVTGEQFDTGWAYVRNLRLADHLAASALAAGVTGADADAERATGILVDLAEVYPSLPVHGTKVGQAKLMAQSLEEAVAATTLARSYALVQDRMSDPQRAAVGARLFRPMAELINSQLMNRTHNIEVWHLAGLASLAVVLDDHDLGAATLGGEHGFHRQLTDGLRPDGWWYEGSPGYHFYMLTAVLNAVEAYRALGIDTDVAPVLERMLVTPVQTVRNDLTVPAVNDSSLVTAVPPGIAAHADLYFRGARLCRGDGLERFLGSQLAAGFDRSSPAYLVYGRPDAERAAPAADGWPVERRDVLPDSGYAILRQPAAQSGSGPDTCAFLKFGPHGGGHGHPDKLEIDVMIDGSRVITDPGTGMYTNPIHRPWYVQTWSHSTVLIDRISQPPISGNLLGHRQVSRQRFGCADAVVTFGAEADVEGRNVLWHTDDPAPVAAYAGASIRRLLAMVPPELGDYLLDLVLVDLPNPRTIDLITHVRGAHACQPGRSAPDRLLLPHFDDVRRCEPDGRSDYLLTDGDRGWSRWHAGAEEALSAETPSNPTHQRCASTVERVVGRRASLAAVLPLGSGGPSGLRWASADVVEVTQDGSLHRWTLGPELRAEQPTRWTEPPIRYEVAATH